MNLTYIDYYKSSYKNNMKKLYINSVIKEERFPFWILKSCIKNKNIHFNAILENKSFIGIYYLVNCDNSVYLMYLAIEKDKRGKKYGSKVLKNLIKKYKTIFLSIEKNNSIESNKRKQFYLKNGFYETNKFYIDNGVSYEVLCTAKNYKITEDVLKKRYSNMTNSKIIKFLISKIFNTNNITFINEKR